MISFKEYLDSDPNVLFGISKSDELNESLAVDTLHFIGPKEALPHEKPLMAGVYADLDSDDGYVHVRNDGTKLRLKSEESARMFSDSLRRSHVKRLTDVNDILVEHYKPAHVYQKHVDAMKHYTMPENRSLNKKILAGAELTPLEHEHVKHLDAALSHIKTPDELVVYTGTNEQHAKILRKKTVVNHPSFVSTSISSNAAKAFAAPHNGDIVEVHIPKGHPGVYAAQSSLVPDEGEFILPRNTKFRIHRDKEKIMSTPNQTYRVHYATIEQE